MSTLGAIVLLAAFFVGFGLLHRGAAKPSCGGCEHARDGEGCTACPSEGALRH